MNNIYIYIRTYMREEIYKVDHQITITVYTDVWTAYD